MDAAAVILAIDHPARIPEGPPRDIGRPSDAGSVGLEEVEAVGRAMVDAAAEEDEKDEEAAGCEQDEGREAQDGPYKIAHL